MTDEPSADRSASRSSERTALERSALERALGLIAEVRAGEGPSVVLLATALFLLLMAYYLIKPVREALILQHASGAEYKSWLGAAIAIALVFVVRVYANLADRLPRNRLVIGVTLFFASHLVAFYGLSSLDGARQSLWLSLTFFIWVGIFNMMLVAQLWAFGNDLYTQEQGKRLFAIVMLGASIGSIAGGLVKKALSTLFGTFDMLLVGVGALVGVAFIVQVVHRMNVPPGEGAEPTDGSEPGPPKASPKGAFSMVLRHRYLTLIALFSLVFTLVNSNGEYVLGKLVKHAAAERELVGSEMIAFIAERYNAFYQWVNTASLVMQLFVVSRLVRYAGISRAFFVLPFIALLDGVAVFAAPVLGVIFIGKIAENSVDYSLNNTLRQMLWLPTTREMKYKAKQAVDTFFVRMGDVAHAAWVAVGVEVWGLEVRSFAGVNALLVVVWIALVWGIVQSHRRVEAEGFGEQATVPGGAESEPG